jgi:hypothetical protein
MNTVTVVCTIHEEVGLATVSELAGILDSVEPSVIFLEVPGAAIEEFYVTRIRGNLESKAVALHLDNHQAALVPVDKRTPDGAFFEDWAYLEGRVRSESPELRQLIRQDKAHVEIYGFRYLNSRYCDQHWSAFYKEMRRTIESLNESRLLDIFAAWVETHALRERVMMERIREYCRANDFGKGLFLVGSAHRRALMEMTTASHAIESAHLNWDFLSYGD